MSEGASSSWHERPEARAALTDRDVCAVYRLLQQVGISQREIARRTGQSQSEVSDIVAGRSPGPGSPWLADPWTSWASY